MANRFIVVEITAEGTGYTATVARITEQNRRLGQESRKAAEQANVGFQRATGAAGNFNRAIGPLTASLTMLTGVAGGFASSLINLVRFGLNPVTLAVTAVIAGIGALTKGWHDSKKAGEEFNKLMADHHKTLSLANLEYRKTIGVVSELDVALGKLAHSPTAKSLEQAEAEARRIKSIREASMVFGRPGLSEFTLGLFGASEQHLKAAEANVKQLESHLQSLATIARREAAQKRVEEAQKEADRIRNVMLEQLYGPLETFNETYSDSWREALKINKEELDRFMDGVAEAVKQQDELGEISRAELEGAIARGRQEAAEREEALASWHREPRCR